MTKLTAGRLRELLDYNAETGEFFWRWRSGTDRGTNIFNAKFAGRVAGHAGRSGWSIKVDGHDYPASWLAHLYISGDWPDLTQFKVGELTAEKLRELLHYDPDSGLFTWKERPGANRHTKTWNRKNAGKPAGVVSSHQSQGYRIIGIGGRRYKASRLAFLYMTGEFPPNDADHINSRRAEDRWDNLRPGTRSQNNFNKRVRKDSEIGLKGVQPYRQKRATRYMAKIKRSDRQAYLGTFDTPEQAGAAYAIAAFTLHGEFFRPPPEPIKFDVTMQFVGQILQKIGMKPASQIAARPPDLNDPAFREAA